MKHLQTLKYIEKVARAGSLRNAAEELNLTASALNRRILAVEEELGVEIFERHPAGLRPNIAGEILLKHIRDQLADMERVHSRIADLTGMRAGHINIATTREPVQYFLPDLIKQHLVEFPAVTFAVNLFERGEAEQSLLDNSSDIAIVYEPMHLQDMQTVFAGAQEMFVIMAADHPLARKTGKIKIYECAEYPLLLPKRPEGMRQVLDNLAAKLGFALTPAVESNSLDLLRLMAQDTRALSFSLAVNLRPDLKAERMLSRPLDLQGVPMGILFAGYLRGRTLPVAAARFLEVINRELSRKFG